METTLSTPPVEDLDLMRPFYPTLTDIDQTDMNLNMSLTLDDEESAALSRAFSGCPQEVTGLATELDDINIAEEPTTVAPLATLIAVDCSSDRSTSHSVTSDSASDKNQSATRQYTPPTPLSNTPSPPPAPVTPSAPTDMRINQDQHQEPQAPSTPELAQRFAEHFHEEWISLNHFSNTAPQPPAQMIVGYYPVEYPPEVAMYRPMNYPGHTPMQRPIDLGQFYPQVMFYTPMGPSMPPTYPIPPPPRRASPVSNKRMFEFVEPEVPENFVANPNNHGRWQYDKNGNRHYLNAPKTKKPCTK